MLLTKDRLIAARDPHGFRPLALGRLGDALIVCSETCALDLIGATYVRDVEPGEVLVVSDGGLRSLRPFPPAPLAHCVFEHVYFARPDSYVFGKQRQRGADGARAHAGAGIRRRGGRRRADPRLRRLRGARASRKSPGIPMEMGLIRNHYVGRTFIQPQQAIRHFGVKVKLNPVRSMLEGKRVVLVDDSIVRGTTSRKIVKMVRAAGAREVHMRISCPPTMSPCFYGVDTPQPLRADRRDPDRRRDPRVHRSGQPRVSESRGAAARRSPGRRVVLHVVLHRGVSGRPFPRDEQAYLQLALKAIE